MDKSSALLLIAVLFHFGLCQNKRRTDDVSAVGFSAPPEVNISEGLSAVICFTATDLSHSVVIELEVMDITTSSDDFNHSSIPRTIILSVEMPVQCLQIPVFKNFDNDTDTESFAIVDPVSTFRVLITIFKNCLNGEIKLAGGRDNTEGVLKICKDGSFKNLCSSIWTVQNANDACKKLGFISSQNIFPLLGAIFENEENSANDEMCSIRQAVAVQCQGTKCLPFTKVRACPAGCIDGDSLPLLGGTSPWEGLVEICAGNEYLPVDIATFSIHEANVLCRQMKLGTAGFPISTTDDLGLDVSELEESRTAIALCTGREQSLAECSISWKATIVTDYAAVQCIDSVECDDGEMRLVGPNGTVGKEGRVEICFQGVWGAVFDRHWSALDAAITCQQLGFDAADALPLPSVVYVTDPVVLPIVYDSPACDSLAYGSILACPRLMVQCEANVDSGSGSGSGGSAGGEEELVGLLGTLTGGGEYVGRVALNGIVGVKCEDSNLFECSNFDVRLVFREASTAAGNLEICLDNQWNQVCSETFGQAELNVVCRALGFQAFEHGFEEHHFLTPLIFNSATVPLQNTFNCSGFERHLANCSRSHTAVETCSNTRIECLSSPRIFFDPFLSTDSFTIEEDRRARLRCSVDQFSYPPINRIVAEGAMLTTIAKTSFCLSVALYVTESAQTSDGGSYSCIVTSGGVNTSQSVQVTVQSYEGNYTSEFLRLTVDSSSLTFTLDRLVFDSINPSLPGLQSVSCQPVTRRRQERAKNLDRYQCVILDFASSTVRDEDVFTPTEAAVAVLDRLYPFISMIRVSGLGFCDASLTEFGGQIYEWPEIERGEKIELPCPPGSSLNAVVTRFCSIGGGWQAPDTSVCGNILTFSEVLTINVTQENFRTVVGTLATKLKETEDNVTQQTTSLLESVADIFERVAYISSDINITISPQVMRGLLNSLSSLKQWTGDIFLKNNSINRIVMSFEAVAAEFTQRLPYPYNFTIPGQIVFTAESTSLELLRKTGRKFVTSGDSLEAGDSAERASQEASIFLPLALFKSLTGTSVGVFSTFYSTATLFPLRPVAEDKIQQSVQQRIIVGSPVLSASIGLASELVNLEPPDVIEVKIRLSSDLPEGTSRVNGSERCVFWDFTAAGGLGNWSSFGCVKVSSRNGVVTCQCNHLTNFAILVDICSRLEDCQNDPILEETLSFITYIGVCLSMLGLGSTVITMLAFKRLRHREASGYHIQLCTAIFLMLLVFALGIEETSVYGGCVVVSVLLHYFTLAAILWMGAESILMFRKLVFVFKQVSKTYFIILSLICWLAPLVPVLIPLITDLANGNDPSSDLIIRRGEFCFLSNTVVFWTAFLGPIFVIILMNAVLYVVVVTVMLKHSCKTMARRKQPERTRTILQLMLSVTGVMFLFGITWILAALTITVQSLRSTAQILFATFNSFQGFGIFIFFCVLNKDVRELWKQALSCGQYKSKHLYPHLNNATHQRIHSSSATASLHTARGFGARTTSTSEDKYRDHLGPPTHHTITAGEEAAREPPQVAITEGHAMVARVRRYSTRRLHQHHVEEFEVDFSASSEEECEETF